MRLLQSKKMLKTRPFQGGEHPSEGEICSMIDQETSPPQAEAIRQHLETCDQCRELSSELAALASKTNRRLSSLTPTGASLPASRNARPRLTTFIIQKENVSMRNKIFNRRNRLAWAGAGLVILLAISLAFPPVQAIANNFLGLFRVQRFAVVQVNPSNLPEQLGSSSQFESMLSEDVKIEQVGAEQEVASPEDASALAGFTVRLPTDVTGERQLFVGPGGKVTLNVDLEHIQALLDEIGRSDIRLPAVLEGAAVTVDIPLSVRAMYGACQSDLEEARQEGYDPDDSTLPRLPKCTTLVQLPSPEINAPPGLDINKIGEAYLQILGMSRTDAEKFAQSVDWTSTFVIPIPRYGTNYYEVTVDDVKGTLIEQRLEDHPRQYLLLWVKDGILYALTGPGNSSTALTIASSMK